MILHRLRSGYTLIEMLAVMSLFSILMSLAVAWILQTMKFDAAVRERLEYHQTLLTIDRLLRDDIRRARAISVDENQQLLMVFSRTNQVEQSASFQLTPSEIRYTRRAGRVIERSETFRLDSRGSCRWDLSELPSSIGLIVDRTSAAGDDSPTDLHTRATLDPVLGAASLRRIE
jgi:prepilin-type N-terminal cleavage/methylation domain-containing protein